MEQFKRWQTLKLEAQVILAFIMCIFGMVLIMMGFWVSPIGEIHESVIVTFGEILVFAGTILGISYTYNSKYQNLKTKIKDNEEKINQLNQSTN